MRKTELTGLDDSKIEDVLLELRALRRDLLRLEKEFELCLARYTVHPKSALNLIHYLALRGHDIRRLQEKLAALGLSSLGRTESHVLAVRVLDDILCRMEAHQSKKSARLRRLHLSAFTNAAWTPGERSASLTKIGVSRC